MSMMLVCQVGGLFIVNRTHTATTLGGIQAFISDTLFRVLYVHGLLQQQLVVGVGCGALIFVQPMLRICAHAQE